MRRVPSLVVMSSIVGCGLGVVGTAGPPPAGAEVEAGVVEREASVPVAPSDDGGSDASNDAGPLRPDAGVPFVPSHLSPTAYVVDAPDVTGLVAIDTTTLQIDKGSGKVSDPHFVVDGEIAVLSTGALTVDKQLDVTGSRPLAIVAAKNVRIEALLNAGAKATTPGPGGASAGGGVGAGGASVPGGNTDYGAGGGAGHGTAGAEGGARGSSAGGAAGAVYNPNGALLVGGSGGGHGATANEPSCDGYGLGGAGGGAIQISTVGTIVVTANGRIHVGGGGGLGGCNGAGGIVRGGGGGGGSGGLVYLEAIKGIDLQFASFVTAGGGGGGEGGDKSTGGGGGADAPISLLPAQGGSGFANGGNGGAGGASTGIGPVKGVDGVVTSGGGGGASGRLFLRTRGADIAQAGGVTAVVVKDTSF